MGKMDAQWAINTLWGLVILLGSVWIKSISSTHTKLNEKIENQEKAHNDLQLKTQANISELKIEMLNEFSEIKTLIANNGNAHN